jgi:S-adenosylmethionine-diacylgycerolhomoserine-N-methlytransferase
VLRDDWRTLWALVRPQPTLGSHAASLQHFYQAQAGDYDRFRERLLTGREELIDALPLSPGATWVDVGGGTACNLHYAGDRLATLSRAVIVDLTPSLLAVANARRRQERWANVTLIHGDATTLPMGDGTADVVTFSYSLTMIPEWKAALAEAARVLKPGGVIGVADFYVSTQQPSSLAHHGVLTRAFWPRWFGQRHVRLNPEHLPALVESFEPLRIVETRAPVPYLPIGRVPVYRFIGQKRARTSAPPRLN